MLMWGQPPRLSRSSTARRTPSLFARYRFVLTPHPNRSKMHPMRARLWAPHLKDVRKEGVRGTSERHGQVVQ